MQMPHKILHGPLPPGTRGSLPMAECGVPASIYRKPRRTPEIHKSLMNESREVPNQMWASKSSFNQKKGFPSVSLSNTLLHEL